MNQDECKEMAKARARETLAQSATFRGLSHDEQKALYMDLFKKEYKSLQDGNGVSNTGSNIINPSKAMADPEKASDLIDDSRHANPNLEKAGDLAGDFMDQVDFPGFVQDLLKGVFDANLKVSLEQMEAFQNLLKTATKDLSHFIRSIDDTAAFGYLAENNSDDFNIDFSDSEKDENGQPQAMLTNTAGEKLDIGDNEVKAKIMEAKIKMAQEQRHLLRETLMFGVTRLVVEKGNVKASVVFDIKASEQVAKNDKAALKESVSSGNSISGGGGLLGKILGGVNGGRTSSRRKTQISVSSTQSQSSTDLAAKIAGSVDITFKTDYFKLDNFAKMYGNVSDADQQAAAGQPAAATS